MSETTRRTFIASSAALPVGLGALSTARAQDTPAIGHATTIVTGGRVLTMNPAAPAAEALAVQGDRIVAVGSNDDIRALADADTEQIDARGMTVTPGFIDAHSHPLFAEEAVGVTVISSRV